MNKRILNLLFVCLSSATVVAQTPPDFTVTDTEGNSLNLYNTLNSGKTIMLDFFFTTCPPCIENVDNIEHIYQQFGAGQGMFDIWGINDRNSDAQVIAYKAAQGVTNPCASGSEGNALSVVNQYSSVYNFTGFPTYSIICPDKSMTWDVWPISTNAPQIAAALTNDCGLQPSAAGVGDNEKTTDVVLYPNPANEYTRIDYVLKNAGVLKFEVYNILGSLVKTITPGQVNAGHKTTSLQVAELPSGNYAVRMLLNNETIHIVKLNVIR